MAHSRYSINFLEQMNGCHFTKDEGHQSKKIQSSQENGEVNERHLGSVVKSFKRLFFNSD